MMRLALPRPTAAPTATIALARRHCRSHCHVGTADFNTPHTVQGAKRPSTACLDVPPAAVDAMLPEPAAPYCYDIADGYDLGGLFSSHPLSFLYGKD